MGMFWVFMKSAAMRVLSRQADHADFVL